MITPDDLSVGPMVEDNHFVKKLQVLLLDKSLLGIVQCIAIVCSNSITFGQPTSTATLAHLGISCFPT